MKKFKIKLLKLCSKLVEFILKFSDKLNNFLNKLYTSLINKQIKLLNT